MRTFTRLNSGNILWLLFATLLSFGWVAAHYWATRGDFLDDAYIGFVYLRNLAGGHGFVFYPGQEANEGVSNIGWLLLLIPWGDSSSLPLAAKLLGIAAALGAAIVTHQTVRAILASLKAPVARYTAAALPAILAFATFEFFYFSSAGMETGLLALLCAGFIEAARRAPYSPVLAVLGCWMFLAHPEGILVYPVYLALLFLTSSPMKELRRVRAAAGLFLLLIAAVTALRYSIFGDLLPNTYGAKRTVVPVVLNNLFGMLSGENPHLPSAISSLWWLIAPVALLAFFHPARRQPVLCALAAVMSAGAAFAVYAPFDWTGTGRYLAPYLITFYTLFLLGIDSLAALLKKAPHAGGVVHALGLIAALLLASVSLANTATRFSNSYRNTFPGTVVYSRSLITPAQWMNETLPPTAVIASRRIGALAYYAHRPVFDYSWGLTEPSVASRLPTETRNFGNPNHPQLKDVWQAIAPQYLLESEDIIDSLLRMAGSDSKILHVHGLRYVPLQKFPIGIGEHWILYERGLERPS